MHNTMWIVDKYKIVKVINNQSCNDCKFNQRSCTKGLNDGITVKKYCSEWEFDATSQDSNCKTFFDFKDALLHHAKLKYTVNTIVNYNGTKYLLNGYIFWKDNGNIYSPSNGQMILIYDRSTAKWTDIVTTPKEKWIADKNDIFKIESLSDYLKYTSDKDLEWEYKIFDNKIDALLFTAKLKFPVDTSFNRLRTLYSLGDYMTVNSKMEGVISKHYEAIESPSLRIYNHGSILWIDGKWAKYIDKAYELDKRKRKRESEFYKKISEWLTPLGFTPIYDNHPNLTPRRFDFIGHCVRVQCFCDLSEDYFQLYYHTFENPDEYKMSSKYEICRNDLMDLIAKFLPKKDSVKTSDQVKDVHDSIWKVDLKTNRIEKVVISMKGDLFSANKTSEYFSTEELAKNYLSELYNSELEKLNQKFNIK